MYKDKPRNSLSACSPGLVHVSQVHAIYVRRKLRPICPVRRQSQGCPRVTICRHGALARYVRSADGVYAPESLVFTTHDASRLSFDVSHTGCPTNRDGPITFYIRPISFSFSPVSLSYASIKSCAGVIFKQNRKNFQKCLSIFKTVTGTPA